MFFYSKICKCILKSPACWEITLHYNNNNENFIEIHILLIYTIVNLTLIKVIYNWLHESHKTTNTSTNGRNNYLNGYTCNVFNSNTLRVWVQPILYFYSRKYSKFL